jgi:PPOX class probable F420-dependent enzyme
MQTMTPDEVRAFLLASPRTATLATIRVDERTHAAPIWFDLDGEEVVFTTWHASVKAANLRRDPRLALCVDDEAPPSPTP